MDLNRWFSWPTYCKIPKKEIEMYYRQLQNPLKKSEPILIAKPIEKIWKNPLRCITVNCKTHWKDLKPIQLQNPFPLDPFNCRSQTCAFICKKSFNCRTYLHHHHHRQQNPFKPIIIWDWVLSQTTIVMYISLLCEYSWKKEGRRESGRGRGKEEREEEE